MRARDFRARAREALKGNWLLALVTTLIAGVLGGTIVTTLNVSGGGAAASGSAAAAPAQSSAGQLADKLRSFIAQLAPDEMAVFSGILLAAAAFAVTTVSLAAVLGLIKLILGGAVSFGYADFQFRLLDRNEPSVGNVFSKLRYIGKGFGMNFLMGLYVFLWSLLLVIPGIIKAFSYAMTPYILSENPDLTVKQAITRSRKLMNGNKWRLFCLHLSFIGWDILASFTFGIGNLWLNPYKECAEAAFYREIKAEKARDRF